MVSEKNFYVFFHYKSMGAIDPHDMASLDPRGLIGKILLRSTKCCYILNMYGFLSFSNNKSMEAIDPQGVASFDPRGLISRIYVEDHLPYMN